jgi:hypothetical protein
MRQREERSGSLMASFGRSRLRVFGRGDRVVECKGVVFDQQERKRSRT